MRAYDYQYFGDEHSPLREDPVFRKYMEEYVVLDKIVGEMEAKRGYLSYEEVMELNKVKKLKLAAKDEMERCKRKLSVHTT